MNENIEKVLAALDGFRMSDEMTYSAYSTLHDEISLLDDFLKKQEPEKVKNIVSTAVSAIGECPSCGAGLNTSFLIGQRKTKFCYNCGQAVKWE